METIKKLNDYQDAALETAVYPENMKVIYPALGINGEAGEVAEKVKKIYRDHSGIMDDDARRAIMKELGDVLWYVAVMAHDIGYSLQEVANANIEKLKSRQQRGKLNGNGDER